MTVLLSLTAFKIVTFPVTARADTGLGARQIGLHHGTGNKGIDLGHAVSLAVSLAYASSKYPAGGLHLRWTGIRRLSGFRRPARAIRDARDTVFRKPDR
jgi:hypothetical protein